jgi:chromosome segregation ATPase
MCRLQASQKQNKVLAFEADSLLAQVAVLNAKNKECAAVIEQKNSDIEAQIAAAEGLSASLKSKEQLSGSSANRARQLAAELEQTARKSDEFERQLAALQAQLDTAEREHSERLASRSSQPASPTVLGCSPPFVG